MNAAEEASSRPSRGEVLLRRLRWWDLPGVVRLERELFGGTAWSEATFWSELAHPESRWYVLAEPAGARGSAVTHEGHARPLGNAGPLGYAGLMVQGAQADVQTLAVAPAAQGRGVGAILLRALMQEAEARGATGMLLEVRADNAPAVALYRRHGFERIAVRRAYYQPGGVDAWVMRCRPLAEALRTAAPTLVAP